ncbi:hypothetical protein BDM02DRAFT_3193376 [Thelephora ganbajun]|uniref:Uncharacterized protein n=1 Tax=Thelephora ganbajun TaxID=370292 RepID=A0ACB6YYS6_THEGA|nr:hypothetical protein BDM02DRAFT_3193376 [Thelephora ganbajun]
MSQSFFLLLNGFCVSRRDAARPRPIRSPLGVDLTRFVMSGSRSQWYFPRFPSALYTDSIWVAAMASYKSNVARGAASLLGSDVTLTDLLTRSEDRQFLLGRNAALEREVEELKQMVARLDGEFGILLARVEALEWTAPSEYLSVEDLLWVGSEGEVASLDSGEAAMLGLRSDFQDLVDRPDPVDTTAPLFLHSF